MYQQLVKCLSVYCQSGKPSDLVGCRELLICARTLSWYSALAGRLCRFLLLRPLFAYTFTFQDMDQINRFRTTRPSWLGFDLQRCVSSSTSTCMTSFHQAGEPYLVLGLLSSCSDWRSHGLLLHLWYVDTQNADKLQELSQSGVKNTYCSFHVCRFVFHHLIFFKKTVRNWSDPDKLSATIFQL